MSEDGEEKLKEKWIHTLLTPQFLIIIGSGFVSICLTYFKFTAMQQDLIKIQTKIESLEENKATKSDQNATHDQVVRQYGAQREMNDATNKKIDEQGKWIEYHKGYEQAKKDYLK